MDRWKIRQTVNLAQSGSGPAVWPEALMLVGDRAAHTWEVTVTDNGAKPNLAGARVTAYFNRADNACVPVQGTIQDNVASVTLVNECYAVPGPMVGLFRLSTTDGVILTASMLRFTVGPGPADATVDPGHIIPSLDDLLAQIDEMEKGTQAANTAASSANTAAGKANTAASNADAATSKANTAAANADTATGKANTAASAANTAAGAANTAAKAANDAAARVDTSTDAATKAAQAANTAAGAANTAAGKADTATAAANKAAGDATTAANAANTAASAANTAAGAANTAAGKANDGAARVDAVVEAAQEAADTVKRLTDVTLEVEMLPPSAEPTADVTQTETQTTFHFGIPSSNLAYATFEVEAETMSLLMHAPDGFTDIKFSLNDNAEMEVSV